MICQSTGCTREATHFPKLCVPAIGWPIDAHQPISAVLGVKLCRDHAKAFPPANKQTPEVRKAIEAAARMMRKAPPDFARSFIQPIRIDCPEGQKYARALRGEGT